MAYVVLHTAIGYAPHWYVLDNHATLEGAARRARNYALDCGGYVCVQDTAGNTVFGTDPAALDRSISNGICASFPKEAARRLGCCA